MSTGVPNPAEEEHLEGELHRKLEEVIDLLHRLKALRRALG